MIQAYVLGKDISEIAKNELDENYFRTLYITIDKIVKENKIEIPSLN